jgi:hypothetical protein
MDGEIQEITIAGKTYRCQPIDISKMDKNTIDALQDIPTEIIQMANKIDQYMQEKGYRDWCLGGIADRGYTMRLREENKKIKNDLAESLEWLEATFRCGLDTDLEEGIEYFIQTTKSKEMTE